MCLRIKERDRGPTLEHLNAIETLLFESELQNHKVMNINFILEILCHPFHTAKQCVYVQKKLLFLGDSHLV